MNLIEILGIIIATSLIIIFVWNLRQYANFKSRSLAKTEEISDARYFELKYKQEFILAIFTVITVTASLLGYNSITTIRTALQQSINDSLKAPLQKLDSFKTALDDANQIISDFENRQAGVNSNLSQAELKIKHTQSLAERLSSNKILKQEIHIVKDLKFSPFIGPDWAPEKTIYYFKDLKNTLGEPLPKFSQPPIILPTTNASATVMAYNITTTSFNLGSYTTDTLGVDTKDYSVKISLLIYKIPD